jgi:hypothetical protein
MIREGSFLAETMQKLLMADLVFLPANTSIDPHTANRYLIAKAGVAALTIPAPNPGSDDGLEICIA